MRISDWISDVCSSDLPGFPKGAVQRFAEARGGLPQCCRIGLRHEGADRLILYESGVDGVEMMILHRMGRGGEGEEIVDGGRDLERALVAENGKEGGRERGGEEE